jgi:hypothetical protein
MASFEQDLIIFEDDTLMLQYTFTDLEGTFTTSNSAWWGAVSSSAWHPGGDPPATILGLTVEKASSSPNAWTGMPGGFPTSGITVVNGDTIVRVFFTQADFGASAISPLPDTTGLQTNAEYYTELVLSTNNQDNTSVVAATGKLFISASIFSAAGYRPL